MFANSNVFEQAAMFTDNVRLTMDDFVSILPAHHGDAVREACWDEATVCLDKHTVRIADNCGIIVFPSARIMNGLLAGTLSARQLNQSNRTAPEGNS